MSVLQIEEAGGCPGLPARAGMDIKAAYLAADDGAMVYDVHRITTPGPHCFDPEHWRGRADVLPVPGGRARVLRIVLPGQDWILRHFHRGGWMGSVTADRYLWTGLARSRPWREWHLLYDLYRAGFPVPRPIAARVQRIQRWWYRADLISERVDGEPLSVVLRRAVVPQRLWYHIGAQIRCFHRAGVYHADLNLDNILIEPDQRVCLLDFDKSRRRRPRASWQNANLRRLRRSLLKAQMRTPDLSFSPADWSELLIGYAEG
ncbi:MAG: hypothetical protein AMXMBFR76_15940 [Pseudomonadota bacterium]